MRVPASERPWPALVLSLALAGCTPGFQGPFAELEANGMSRYFGSFLPVARDVRDDGTTVYQWDTDGGNGPVCLDGSPFHAMTRDLGNDDFILYFQGGGACWDEVCISPRESMTTFPNIDMLNPFEPSNPVAGWSSVVIPYCDGSFLVGDASIPEGADDFAPREQRGLRNLSAALDMMERFLAPPDRILLVGASGGGYGALLGLPVVRMKFPDAKLFVLHDSGPGIARPGDAELIPNLVEQWGGEGVLPESCEGCFDEGAITRLSDWQLERDDDLVIGDYSTWQDFLISDVFLQIGGEAYAEALDRETRYLADKWPGRYARFIESGNQHTATAGDINGMFGIVPPDLAPAVGLIDFKTLRSARIDGVGLGDWVGAMLAGDGWFNLVEPRESSLP